ncbi:RNA polymerase sigma factor [Microlunatus sp. GCM10028923]|uniref:RNA polymerase sigma factor n=1 Tax=Microlunatus sp. GCM10028923 TaxID=3273400 RepID=UPI00360E1F87
MTSDDLGELWRELAPQVLGTLVRRYQDFDGCEDATQEALLAAMTQWPAEGLPEQPRSWLVTVASRRLLDHRRSESARRARERLDAERDVAGPPGEDHDHDDSLELLFMCCHPALTPPSQVALTLRAVGGLTTTEIASAFLVPPATMGPRISRAKGRIKAAGATLHRPDPAEYAERLPAVLQTLYLIFNEGYTASSGPELQRTDLTAEAIRLTRTLHRSLPGDGEVAGLLALMLLTDARRATRTGPDGGLVPLAEQDRSRWDGGRIEEGSRLITEAMQASPLGPYQLQAAIAALHVQAATVADTDWRQIRILYRVLCRIAPNPMASLNHAIAIAMTDGPRAGLDRLAELAADEPLAGHHRLPATRAHLLELAGDTAAAREDFLLAARLTTSLPEQRYLRSRADRLRTDPTDERPPHDDSTR